MTTVLLIRHGRTASNAAGTLAGWTTGVGLDDTGTAQARALAERLAPVPLAAVVASPLQRTRETAEIIAAGRTGTNALDPVVEERLGEVRYGEWTGQSLKTLAKDPLWKVVQQHPSAAVFPGGEALAAVASRAIAAVREWNAKLGTDATYAVVSHGDVIKAVLADALGSHLDSFQRIIVDPCSVSVVRYTDTRPFVVCVNDVGGDIAALIPPKRRRRRQPSGTAGARRTERSRASASDAAVGGGSGTV